MAQAPFILNDTVTPPLPPMNHFYLKNYEHTI